jgi:eukaryotic sulfide quinone oxidoreductase
LACFDSLLLIAQPGWTLVGSGLKSLDDVQRPLPQVIPEGVKHYPLQVSTFDPENNVVKTSEGVDISYDYLIVAPGLEINFAGVSGLQEALQDPASQVSSIYSEKTMEKVWRDIQAFKKGPAIFTQPAGIIKCAGAPQKIMWMALSQWRRDGVRDNIDITFATGAPGKRTSTLLFSCLGYVYADLAHSHVCCPEIRSGFRELAERT